MRTEVDRVWFWTQRWWLAVVALISATLGLAVPAVAAPGLDGRIEVGGRVLDRSGDRSKYRQHINLEDGLRLFNLALSYRPEKGSSRALDLVTLDAQGLGGDPYQNARLVARKYGRYRFQYEHRKSDYFYQDQLFRTNEVDLEGSRIGDLHLFNLERTNDRLDLNLHLSSRAKLSLAFDRNRRRGDSTSVLDIQREEFVLNSPVTQTRKQWDLGLEYAWEQVTLSYHHRWRDLDHSLSHRSDGPSEGLDEEAPSRVNDFLFGQPYEYRNREHQFTVLLRPTERWRLQLDLLTSVLDTDVSHSEIADGNDFRDLPFTTTDQSFGDIERDVDQYSVAASFAVTDRLRLTGSARTQRLDQQGLLLFEQPNQTESQWQLDSDRFTFGVEAVPSNTWTLAAGWSRQQRQTDWQLASVAADERADERSTSHGYWYQFAYRPNSRLEIRGSGEIDSVDDAFARAVATDIQRLRLQGRYRWDNGLAAMISHQRRDSENEDSDWKSESVQSMVRVSSVGASVTGSLGYTWVDLDRSIRQLVRGGFRQDLFDIDYHADSDYWDADVQWTPSERWSFNASYLHYRNSGSFRTRRSDYRVGASTQVGPTGRVHLRLRHSDFDEPPDEHFNANLVELAFEYHVRPK